MTVLSHPPDSGAWDATRFAGVRPPGPHDGVIEPGLVLSPSQAEMYEQCPRRYVLERRLRVEDSTSAPAQFGSLCHALLETIERRTLDQGRRPSLEEAVEVLDQVWEEAEFGSPVLDAAYRAKAARLLERLWADWPADSAEPVALEHHLELDLGGVRWVGKADRIERTTRGELRIVDYKTRKSLPTIEEAAGSLQLGFYLLAAGEDPDLDPPPSRAELWFPLADARNFRRAFDPDRLPQIEQRLRAVVEGVLDEAWDPRTGPHCRHCAVRSSCPAWPEGREAFSA